MKTRPFWRTWKWRIKPHGWRGKTTALPGPWWLFVRSCRFFSSSAIWSAIF